MPETTKEVKTLMVEFKCPDCETGFLKPTDRLFADSYQTRYRHYCDNPDCDYTTTFKRTYPYIRYEAIDEKN